MRQFMVANDLAGSRKWFDTLKEAVTFHEQQTPREACVIRVYQEDRGYSFHWIGAIRWGRSTGFYLSGYVDDEGMDLFAKHGAYEEIREVIP